MKKVFIAPFRNFLVWATLLLLPVIAFAHPKEIDLSEMIANCKYIFIAKFTNANFKKTAFQLEVDSVLKGNYSSRSFTAGRAFGTPLLEKGKPFIAFINEKSQLEWAGY
ncbi:MAG TPA: hypothetical protein VFJ43_03680, partial [Bacteroidia bacterium]|nr:hypothetical protein [Bacteroidia bacterium]